MNFIENLKRTGGVKTRLMDLYKLKMFRELISIQEKQLAIMKEVTQRQGRVVQCFRDIKRSLR